jgi:membrane-bound lytic murein transglycosylase B
VGPIWTPARHTVQALNQQRRLRRQRLGPAAWAKYAQDGNRDGVTEIGQIDDAALTAAVYLCETGGDLSVPANFTAALTAYNDSQPYDNRVAQAAQQYAAVA